MPPAPIADEIAPAPASDDAPLPLHRMNEGALHLPGAWQDRTITMLRPAGATGASIVVTRDVVPAEMNFDAYITRQRLLFQRELPSFALVEDVPGELDGHPSHRLEFHWDNRGTPFYQAVVIVCRAGRLLNFTASVPRAAADVATRRTLLWAINSFRFAPPEAAIGDESA